MHLGDRWAPCPAASSTVGAPGPHHLPLLIPRQADLLLPLPRGGTDGFLASQSPKPAGSSNQSSAEAGVGASLGVPGNGNGAPHSVQESAPAKPLLPLGCPGQTQPREEEAPLPSAAPTRPERPGRPSHRPDPPPHSPGLAPSGRGRGDHSSAAELAGRPSPGGRESGRAGRGSQAGAHWPASP